MSTRAAAVTTEILSLLPPFRAFPRARFLIANLVRIHVVVTVVLYGVFILLASANDMMWNRSGIGVLENPPFFAHLLATAFSIPIVVIIVRRIALVLGADEA